MVLIFKYLAFILLASVSGYRSILLFTGLASSLAGSIILGIMQAGLELVKVFALLRIEYSLYLKQSFNAKINLKGSYVLFGALAFYSMMASFGYSLSVVGQQVEISAVETVEVEELSDLQVNFLNNTLAQIDVDIAQLQQQLRDINPDFATGATRLSAQIAELQNQRSEVFSQIVTLRQESIDRTLSSVEEEVITPTRGQVDAYSMFVAMSNAIGLDSPRPMMIVLLLLASILLEIGIVYTSPVINIPDKHRQEVLKESVLLPSSTTGVSKPKTKQKKSPKKKPAPTIAPKKSNEESIVETSEISISSKDVMVDTKALQEESVEEVIAEPPTPRARRVTTEEIVKTLLPSEGDTLISVDTVAGILGVKESKVQEVLSKLQAIKITPPLITQKGDQYTMNYMKTYILQRLNYVRAKEEV